MHHFFIQERPAGERVSITGADVNHIKNVLRMKPGEKILVSCTDGPDYLCSIGEISSEQVLADILEIDEVRRELPARLHLFQGLPKSDKMELIIQKAVELGAIEIIPVAMHNCVVKLDEKKETARGKRWGAIAESAAKQSKRSVIPAVHSLMSYGEAMTYARTMDLVLVPYECTKGMEETKAALELVRPGMDIGIFIGPEGGFTEEEIKQALLAGGRPISLGKRILRTETAGLAILSVLMMQLEMENNCGSIFR